MNNKAFTVGKINPIFALLFLVAIFLGIYWIAKGLFTILSWAFPVMIIATAFINYKVLIGYGKWILDSLRTNPLTGILAIVFSLFAYPLVGIYLLFKAVVSKKIESFEENNAPQGDYIKYEEVGEDDFLDLKELKQAQEKVNNDYKDLF